MRTTRPNYSDILVSARSATAGPAREDAEEHDVYEMYPEAWTAADDRSAPVAPPRRRPRRAHSVLPAVIARQLQLTTPRPVQLG